MDRRQWRPLLEGSEAIETIALVEAIAADIPRYADPASTKVMHPWGGAAGIAVFYFYLAEAVGPERGAGYFELASQYLDRAIAVVADMTLHEIFGIVGVAWAVEHLRGRLLEPDHDCNGDVDHTLATVLAQVPWRGPYDLLSGLVGYGVYAVERTRHAPASADALLRLVLDRLEDTAERTPAGTTWFTRPEIMHPAEKAYAPHGFYNMGMAHGIPGVVAILAAMHDRPLLRARVAPLLASAAAWLCAQRVPPPCRASYPYNIPKDSEAPLEMTRAAWCYGDPGVGIALLAASVALGSEEVRRHALEVLSAAAQRPEIDCGVRDAGLCHGAAGLAHIYNRVYWQTNVTVFAEAARTWSHRAIAMRRPGEGVAGFLERAGQAIQWEPGPGLLTGAAGIGLALLAMATPQEPAWDGLLLTGIS
jgi:lantibiotic modifying enzyme